MGVLPTHEMVTPNEIEKIAGRGQLDLMDASSHVYSWPLTIKPKQTCDKYSPDNITDNTQQWRSSRQWAVTPVWHKNPNPTVTTGFPIFKYQIDRQQRFASHRPQDHPMLTAVSDCSCLGTTRWLPLKYKKWEDEQRPHTEATEQSNKTAQQDMFLPEWSPHYKHSQSLHPVPITQLRQQRSTTTVNSYGQ